MIPWITAGLSTRTKDASQVRITIVGNFGLRQKGTMAARALPIARELARRGHLVTMVLPGDPDASSAQSPKLAAEDRSVVRGWTARSPVSARPLDDDLAPPPTIVAASDLIRLVTLGQPEQSLGRQLGLGLQIAWRAWLSRPEVIYAFKPIRYAGLTLLIFWILRQLGLTRAVLALDTDDWEGNGGWADHDRYPWLQRRLVIWQERWSLRHADVVTVASRELEALVRREREAVLYAPNAASPSSPGWTPGDRIRGRARLGLGAEPLVLAYTRFLEFDPARLVATFAKIRQRVPDARLLVIGRGLAGEEQPFLLAARAHGLLPAIHNVGWVEPIELPDFFAAADVALYLLDDTRLNRAKCLMKLVDLLLAGVPVVADAVGQAIEYVANGKTGLLVRPGDVGAMADEVARLLTDPTRRQALGGQARRTLLERWRWTDQVAAIDQALQRARAVVAT